MAVQMMIDGVEKTFETQAAADEASANAKNRSAALLWAKAAEGGTKFRAERFGLNILRYVVSEQIKTDKVKAKDVTAAQVREYVEAVDEADIKAAVQTAMDLINGYKVLSGKHQAPLKGGKTPRMLAESAAVIVKPESGAAQVETARTNIVNAL
jgi:hypothetical protein